MDRDGVRLENRSRIVRVVKTPVPREAGPPGLLAGGTLGYVCYEPSEGAGFRELPPAPALDASRRSNPRYEELAQSLAKLLRDLRETMSVRAQSPLPPDGTPAPSEVKSPHHINLSDRPSRVALKGRDRAIAQLLRAWKDKRTRVAVISGESGSGKTAILWEFIQRVSDSADAKRCPRPDAIFAWSFANHGHDAFQYRPAAALLKARIAHARQEGVDEALATARDALRQVPVPRLIAVLARYERNDWSC
jgi:hypothetical protein